MFLLKRLEEIAKIKYQNFKINSSKPSKTKLSEQCNKHSFYSFILIQYVNNKPTFLEKKSEMKLHISFTCDILTSGYKHKKHVTV